jgi:hypothetical protein
MSVNKIAILIDGGFFVQRFKANHGKSPRVTDLQPFVDDVMKKVSATNPLGVSDMLLRTFY